MTNSLIPTNNIQLNPMRRLALLNICEGAIRNLGGKISSYEGQDVLGELEPEDKLSELTIMAIRLGAYGAALGKMTDRELSDIDIPTTDGELAEALHNYAQGLCENEINVDDPERARSSVESMIYAADWAKEITGDSNDAPVVEKEDDDAGEKWRAVRLPLEDIAAIRRSLDSYLIGELGFGDGEDNALSRKLGVETGTHEPDGEKFVEVGNKLVSIGRVLEILDLNEYPLDDDARALLDDLVKEVEREAAEPLDEQDKILCLGRLELLRLSQGAVKRVAGEMAVEQ
jgi:hypothetical protein